MIGYIFNLASHWRALKAFLEDSYFFVAGPVRGVCQAVQVPGIYSHEQV